jgi:hypothetical protein
VGKLLLILAAVVLGVIAFLILGGDDDGGRVADYDPSADGDDETFVPGPMLEASGPGTGPDADGRGGRRGPDRPRPRETIDWLAGTVVDASSGEALAGVQIRIEPATAPCPRLPRHGRPTGDIDPTRSGIDMREVVNARTDAEGRFAIEYTVGTHKGPVDVFAFAEGYVTGCVCDVSDDMGIVVRLQPGKRITGRLVDPAGRPVLGAQVLAALPEGRVNLPGTTGETRSDTDGAFVLAELGDEAVVVMVDHPDFVPHDTLPIDPGTGELQEIVLVPAWRLTFLMRSDDGEALRNPTIEWKTSGAFPAAGVELLSASAVGPPARPESELRSDVIRIPTDRRTVDIQIKADGYLRWKTSGEPLPPDGGEREFQLTLERDLSIGRLRIRLIDEGGGPIHFAESGAELSGLTWLGKPEDVPSAIVQEPGDALTFPSIKAGKYRMRFSAPGFGPTTTDVEVPPGGARDVDVTLGPPARLRVRFRSPLRTVVHFRIVKDGHPCYPEREADDATPRDDTTRLTAPEDGGLVVTGLGGGVHTIEVLNDDLAPVSHAVSLEPGALVEAVVDVQPR